MTKPLEEMTAQELLAYLLSKGWQAAPPQVIVLKKNFGQFQEYAIAMPINDEFPEYQRLLKEAIRTFKITEDIYG